MLETLGEAAVRTLLLAGAVQCVLWLLRVRHAQLLLAGWTIVLVASISMPMLQQVTPLRVPLDSTLSRPLIEGASDLLQRPLPQSSFEGASGEFHTQLSPASWLPAIYLVVSGGILLRVVLGVGLSFRLLSRAVPVRAVWAQGTRVRISRDITGPVTIANVILVPISFMEWSIETRQAVLAHEQAHAARWDFAMLIASQLNRALFWFSPLSWWLHRRLVALTELASDDQAMASSRDRLRYAEILLEMGRRSGPVSQGPAMARPATLSHRIDRILLDQVHSWPVKRSRQVLLTVGVASLSLAVASLMPNPIPQPVVGSLATRGDSYAEHAVDRVDQIDAVEQGVTVQHEPVQEAALTPTLPQFGTETVAEAQSHPVFASSPSVPVATAALQLPSTVLRQANRRTVRTMPKGTLSPSPSRTMAWPTQVVAGRGKENDEASLQELSMKETAPRSVRGTDAVTTTNSPTNEKIYSPLSHQIAYGSVIPTLPLVFQGIMGSICTGTVAVGQGAQSSSDKRPYVAAGQLVPARAQFYFKTSGTPWVRFNAFGEPPLDLPVRFTRNGMTWTGDYGIAYTVQASGESHLTGLAALIRNDSARVDLACVKSALHLL